MQDDSAWRMSSHGFVIINIDIECERKKHAILGHEAIGAFLQVELSGNRIETESGAVRDVQGEHDRTWG